MIILSAGSSLALPAAASAAPSPALCEATVQAIDAAAARTLRQGSPGMIIEVARHGELLFSGTYGQADLEQRTAVTRDTVFKLASITKQFTAAAILTLVEEGKLKLDDRLATHVPELKVAAKVRVYDLMVQTSGIADYSEDPSGNKTKSVARTPLEMLGWIEQLTPRLQFEPGSRWAYSNSNYVLLGLIAERVSGKPLATLFRDRLLAPAGLTHTAFDDPSDVVPHRATGYRRSSDAPGGFRHADWISPTVPGAAGALRATSADLIKWADALHGGRILPRNRLTQMVAPGRLADGRTTKLGMPEAWQKGLNSDYAMGLFVKASIGGVRYAHGGDVDGFSTWLAHYPASGITVVQMINSESADLRTDEVEAALFPSPGRPCLRGQDHPPAKASSTAG
jgi:CubicO group peptidase (beta-lactamase class C family)